MEAPAADILIADIAVDIPGHDAFSWRVPDGMALQVGDCVRVPFRRAEARGFVVALRRGPHPDFPLKEIEAVVEGVRLPPALLALVRWGSRYYRSSLGEFLATAVPEPVRRGARPEPVRSVAVVPDHGQKLTPKQAAVVAALGTAELPWAEAQALTGVKPDALRRLADKGVLRIIDEHRVAEVRMDRAAEHHALTDEQRVAVEAVAPHLGGEGGGPAPTFLCYGVTGSGKTLVYLELAERVIAAGRQVLWLLPEIGLTPQAAGRVRARFPRTVTWHSGFTDGERAEMWRAAARGDYDIVLGTRSALFAPLGRIGLIVVDEEHEHSYKQDSAPRYHARDLAVVYGRELNVPVLLGSATPALESIHNGRAGRYRVLTLKQRPAGGSLPGTEVIDMRAECREQGANAVLSRRLVERLATAKERGEQAIVLLNRRGWSPVVQCRACGEAVGCPSCAITLTWHKGAGRLRCHYCGHERPVPPTCPACGEKALGTQGVGTEQLEQLLQEAVPKLSVLRVDADTVATRQGHATLFKAFAEGAADCLVGTQMVAKGLDFPRVTVVGVLAADRGLAMPDFRAAERTWQLVAQVSGRAGRGERPGMVVVQAFDPEAAPLQAALQHRPKTFVDGELALRREYGYPPYGALVRLLWSGPDAARVVQAARQDGPEFVAAAAANGSALLGPAPAAMPLLKGQHRWSALLKGRHRPALQAVLDAALPRLARHANVRLAVDVDPMSTG